MHPLAGTEEHTMQERPSVHDSRRAHAHASKPTPAGSHALRLGEDHTRVRADGPARSSRASRRPTPAHDHARTPSRATARSGREGYVRASVSTPHSTHESALRREFRIRKLFTRALPLALVLIAIVAGFSAWSAHRPITVTINDAKVQLKDDRTIDAAFDLSGIEVKPGDLVDVEGDVLTEGGGTRYTATVDGAAVDDPDRTLKNGAVVQVSDGTNVEEDSTIDENAALPSKRVAKGSGPLCVKQDGHDGVASIKTGSVSGKQVVEEVKQDPVDTTYLRYYPEVGNDKVIALTFDDGPVAKQTEELLDVLADNGAKATFFTIGAQITGTAADDVVREEKDGHQVATHTWDHAAGSGQGVNLSYMTADEQRDEITKGLSGIARRQFPHRLRLGQRRRPHHRADRMEHRHDGLVAPRRRPHRLPDRIGETRRRHPHARRGRRPLPDHRGAQDGAALPQGTGISLHHDRRAAQISPRRRARSQGRGRLVRQT